MPAPPEPQETESPVITPTRVVIGLCLVVPFIAMLWVGSYASLEPRLIGLPFFYWYQMLWVPLSAVLTIVAYKLVKREDAKRRRQNGEDA